MSIFADPSAYIMTDNTCGNEQVAVPAAVRVAR